MLRISRTAISVGAWGYGVCLFDCKEHPPLFSERMGLRFAYRLGRLGIRFFKPRLVIPPPLSGSQVRFRSKMSQLATENGDSFYGALAGTLEWKHPRARDVDDKGGYLVPPHMAEAILDGSFKEYLIQKERERNEREASYCDAFNRGIMDKHEMRAIEEKYGGIRTVGIAFAGHVFAVRAKLNESREVVA